MRTDLCLGLCTDGQCESRDSLLVVLPHQCLHGIVRIIKEEEEIQYVHTASKGL